MFHERNVSGHGITYLTPAPSLQAIERPYPLLHPSTIPPLSHAPLVLYRGGGVANSTPCNHSIFWLHWILLNLHHVTRCIFNKQAKSDFFLFGI